MKKISKPLLDELIRLSRKYWRTGDADLLGTKNNAAMRLSEDTFGDNHHWLAFCDVVSAILGAGGLIPKASNAQIYTVFEAMGYELVEPGREEA